MSRLNDRTNAHVHSLRKAPRARLSCESLEGRALLSGMGGGAAAAGWHTFAAGVDHQPHSGTAAEIHTRGAHPGFAHSGTTGTPSGFDMGGGPGLGGAGSLSDLVGLGMGGPGFGGPDLGMGGSGGHSGPGGHGGPGGNGGPGGPGGFAGKTTPPTLPAAVTTAQSTLQADLNAALPAGFQTPSKATLDALQADLKAQHDGTLTSDAATTKIQADKEAILASTGLTSSQIAAVDAASKQLETDMKAAKPADHATPPTTPSATITADRDAVLAAAGLSSSQISAIDAANAQMMKDTQSIHDGTLSGDAATAALKADHDGLLSALGVSQANIDKIDADTTALQTAMKTAFGSMTPPTTTTGTPTPGGVHGRRFGRG